MGRYMKPSDKTSNVFYVNVGTGTKNSLSTKFIPFNNFPLKIFDYIKNLM